MKKIIPDLSVRAPVVDWPEPNWQRAYRLGKVIGGLIATLMGGAALSLFFIFALSDLPPGVGPKWYAMFIVGAWLTFPYALGHMINWNE